MDLQTAFNVVVSICFFLGGWVLNTIWKTVQSTQDADRELTSKVAAIELLVAGHYVLKADYRSDMTDIKDALLRIEGKLDGKQDKETRR